MLLERLSQARPAVATKVVKGPDLAVFSPDYKHGVVADVENGALSRPAQFGRMGGEQPRRSPDPL
jgi:hypothetical protein